MIPKNSSDLKISKKGKLHVNLKAIHQELEDALDQAHVPGG